jgi:hypothetical protein
MVQRDKASTSKSKLLEDTLKSSRTVKLILFLKIDMLSKDSLIRINFSFCYFVSSLSLRMELSDDFSLEVLLT